MTENEISLKEYFESRLTSIELRTEQARISMDKRLDGMNEFRDSLRDQSANSPTRIELNSEIGAIKAEMAAEMTAIKKDIRELNSFKDGLEGMASRKEVDTARLISFISIGIALLSLGLNLLGK